MELRSSICRGPRRSDLAVFSDIASGQSDPQRGREVKVLAEGLTLGGPEVKAHFVRVKCKNHDASRAVVWECKLRLELLERLGPHLMAFEVRKKFGDLS